MRDNKETVRNFVDVVKNGRKLERLGDFFHEDYVEHNKTVASFGTGLEGYQRFLKHLFTAFPDDVLTIETLLGEGDVVSYRAQETGTHRGEFLGIPATGKSAVWTEVQFFRFQNGKVREHWVDPDIFSWFQQLGVIPKMG